MSFLSEVAVRRLVTVSRTAATATVPRSAFSTTTTFHKTATESARDVLKKADRAVSDKLVDGIDVAANVGTKVKEATQDITTGEATGKAEQYRREASGKASELAGEAKGKASEMEGKAKGAAEQMKKKM
ncbi:hypothetical protein RB597_001260 [Gaeumannomyces tritici]